MLFFAALFFIMGIANHYFFRTAAFDYGLYNFAFWDFAHFHLSDAPMYLGKANLLQDHFSLALIYLSPLYWFLNWLTGSYTLIVLQVAFILLGGWATYRFILIKTSDSILSLMALLFYFLLQGHFSAFLADCNITVIGSCLIPLFLYFFESKKLFIATIIFILILLSKENMPILFIFIFLVLIIWHRKERKTIYLCLSYVGLCIVYFVLVFKVFIPFFATPDKHYDLFNYTALGKTPSEAIMFILAHPLDTFNMLFQNHLGNPTYDGIKEEFYLVYLISGGFLLFYRPYYLLFFIPIIIQKMLNDEPLRWSIEGHYAIEVATLLPISVFMILSDVKYKKIKYALASIACILSMLVTIYMMDPTHHKLQWYGTVKENIFDKEFFHPNFNAQKIHEDLQLIPDTARVCASDAILPHLAQRRFIYQFPNVNDAEYIAAFAYRDNFLVSTGNYNSEFYKYVFSPDWNILANDYPFVLFKKESNTSEYSVMSDSIVCDAENISTDKMNFIATGGQLFDNADTRDSTMAHSGKYSVKLFNEKPYGMTFRDKSINGGEVLQVSAWRHTTVKSNGVMVISSGKELYLPSIEGVDTDAAGWDKIMLYVTVPMNHDDFTIFLWNTSNVPVWFDDLKIERIKKVN
jgi:uncharacterized membrane protein